MDWSYYCTFHKCARWSAQATRPSKPTATAKVCFVAQSGRAEIHCGKLLRKTLIVDLDPRIFFVIVIPDGDPTLATPTQGFAVSLLHMSWAIRAISHLPTHILDLTDEGREVLLARRVTGTSPVHWYGQSPRAVRSIPHPPSAPFTVIILPSSENPRDYEEWAKTSPMRPTIVAESGGDLSELSLELLQAQFLKVCDRIPDTISKESVAVSREAIAAWRPMPARRLDYQVGAHNTIAPNLVSLTLAGYEDIETGPLEQIGSTLTPYVDQIVKTSNSIFDERAKLGERDLQRIFRRPPDLNLFAPSIYPDFFTTPFPLDIDIALRRETLVVRQALERQTGYGFDLKTEAQKKAMIGTIVRGDDGGISTRPNPLIAARASELFLNTELMCALTASEFSVCVRLPNEINRTIGSVRSFAQQFRSKEKKSRKRLLAFRQVQARLAGAVPAEFIDLIKRSESGIRIISDAHVEWLDVDGLPLFIRKNCSRIPVTPGNLFVDQLAPRRRVHLMPQDFSSVLVLSALKREDPIAKFLETAFEVFEPQWRNNLTVTYKTVASEVDLINALNEFKGPMVIFDGHGSHSADEPAKLHLGDEAIDVWSLRDRVHSMPPIVVLSACDTHAADRNHATTANGFMSLGARAVLSSVFPLDARAAASFAARLVYRVSEFVPGAIKLFDEAITWTEVIAGLVRMQLLTDFLRHLEDKKAIDRDTYMRIHLEGNQAINGRSEDPFGIVLDSLEKCGLTRSSLKLDLETAVANSSALSYLLVGRPETIIIDDRDRVAGQLNELEQSP
uniref:CHAT domain-containing protein n=1 Tax=Rhodopseudomonas palustris (strain BisA53) TaxID=316055 RepID=Q07SU5_RHOP5